MAADLKSLTSLPALSMHFITFERRKSEKKGVEEERTICLCFALLCCPLTICEWSRRPTGLCLCIFECVCVCVCVSVLGYEPSSLWCNLFCLLLALIQTIKKTILLILCREMIKCPGRDNVCIVCVLCVWCDWICLYGVRDKTGCLVVM